MKKVLISLGILLTSAFPQIPSYGADIELDRIAIDKSIAQTAPMVYCKSEVQLDCVERVIVEHPDGTLENANYVETRLVKFPDSQGQKVTYGDVLFDFHSGSLTGTLKRLRISTHVQTPIYSTDGKKWGVYWLMLQREALPGEFIKITNSCDGIDYTTCLAYPALDTRDKFHMYFRTSWLKPVAGGGEGIESSLQYQRIPGGMRWRFSGIEFLQPLFKNVDLLRKSVTPEGQNLKTDQLNPTLYAVIDHAGDTQDTSFWDPRCSDFGFTVTMSNAPLAGQLFWDYASESLSFNIYAPHLTPFGSINKGDFHTRFQQAWLNCRFPGNTLSTATKITVQVLDEDGVPQVALSSTSIKDGIIDIQASGFHFSSPKVVAKRSTESASSDSFLTIKYRDDWNDSVLAALTAKSQATSKATKLTILCIKGSVVKRVTGLKPACPKGYKKK